MSELLDTVAEAIWQADVGADLDELYPWDSRDDETTKAHYRRMAQAAIDALQLATEYRYGVRIDPTNPHGVTRDQRRVTKWEPAPRL